MDQYQNSAKKYYQSFLSKFQPPNVFHDATNEDMKSVEEYVDACLKDIHIEEWRVDHQILQQCLYVPLQNMLKKYHKSQELKRRLQDLKDQKQDQMQQLKEQKQKEEGVQKIDPEMRQVESIVTDTKVSHPTKVKPGGDSFEKEIIENSEQQMQDFSATPNVVGDADIHKVKEQESHVQQNMDKDESKLQEAKIVGESSTVEHGSSLSLEDNIEVLEEDDIDQGDRDDGDDDDEEDDDDYVEGDEEEDEEIDDEELGGQEEDHILQEETVAIHVGESATASMQKEETVDTQVGKSTAANVQQEAAKESETEDGEIKDTAPPKSTKDAQNVSKINRKRPNVNPPNAPDAAIKRPRQNVKHVNVNKAQNKNQNQPQSQSQHAMNTVKKNVAGRGTMRKKLVPRNRRGRGRGRPEK
mmetsp:Transcript_6030/g.11433  ORF Transcript_6030/g.11433 Transcript_6030/m.11433 type:complete len:413 (+) Transcript_6030:449-1687(+)